MNFRDNLLRLRTERGMTQEQLANLVGVSRQSVAKWESDRSYPEMDKLIKMTGIFGCTLDELVMGTVGQDAEDDPARRPHDGETGGRGVASSEAGAATNPVADEGGETCQDPVFDTYGYDEHMRSFAHKIAWGVTFIIAGVAVLTGVSGFFGSSDAADTGGLALLFLFVLIGLALIIPAGMGHSEFMQAHPVVRDFYTAEEKQAARQSLSRGIVAGVFCIFLGVVLLVSLGHAFGSSGEEAGTCVLLFLVAAGVHFFIRFGIMFSRVRVAEYNRESLAQIVENLGEGSVAADQVTSRLSSEERRLLFESEDVDESDPEQIAAFFSSKKKKGELTGGICGIIMIVATIVGLCLLFGVPVMSPCFWMAWVVGALCCWVASVAINTFAK